MRKSAVAGWCLYDWAMSAFNTVIGTFVYSVYFAKGVAPDESVGTQLWGQALGISGILIAVLSPVLGAISDRGGRRKPWLAVFTLLCIAATLALWFVKPDASWVLPCLFAIVVANVAFELAGVFYNAMLPDVAPASHYGRVSGWGWGLGYIGGLGALVVCLALLIQTETPLFGLIDPAESGGVRATALLVAVWYAVFALPLFLLGPDRPGTGVPAGRAVREGLATLRGTLARLRHQGNLARFLIASALWRDGISTLTQFGGIFAASAFGMSTPQIITFAILLNVTAGLGAAGFAWVDDRLGARFTIQVSLIGLMITGLCMLAVGTPWWDWAPDPGLPLDFTAPQQWLLVFGMGLGIFFGPAQAAGRSLMARLAPPGLETEMFGLYALSGRVAGLIGPFAYGAATVAFDSQRAGMATVLVLFAAGFALLLTVREPGR
ncbi:MAG TPA: MFS transporter [Azospirillaceae bacterium]|nr:MFS transporter [Azospirillaceae bacterium]